MALLNSSAETLSIACFRYKKAACNCKSLAHSCAVDAKSLRVVEMSFALRASSYPNAKMSWMPMELIQGVLNDLLSSARRPQYHVASVLSMQIALLCPCSLVMVLPRERTFHNKVLFRLLEPNSTPRFLRISQRSLQKLYTDVQHRHLSHGILASSQVRSSPIFRSQPRSPELLVSILSKTAPYCSSCWYARRCQLCSTVADTRCDLLVTQRSASRPPVLCDADVVGGLPSLQLLSTSLLPVVQTTPGCSRR